MSQAWRHTLVFLVGLTQEGGFEANLSYMQVQGQSELHSKTTKGETLNTYWVYRAIHSLASQSHSASDLALPLAVDRTLSKAVAHDIFCPFPDPFLTF